MVAPPSQDLDPKIGHSGPGAHERWRPPPSRQGGWRDANVLADPGAEDLERDRRWGRRGSRDRLAIPLDKGTAPLDPLVPLVGLPSAAESPRFFSR
jgi:hypothetical protein